MFVSCVAGSPTVCAGNGMDSGTMRRVAISSCQLAVTGKHCYLLVWFM